MVIKIYDTDNPRNSAKIKVMPREGYNFISSIEFSGESKLRTFIENFNKITEEDLRNIIEKK